MNKTQIPSEIRQSRNKIKFDRPEGGIFILMRLCNISSQVHLMLCLEKSIAKFPPKQDYTIGLTVMNFFPRSLLSRITQLLSGVQY